MAGTTGSELTKDPENPFIGPQSFDSGNPYVGPQSFTREQRKLFKGRDREKNELSALLSSRRLVLFYAESGAGKTSLINAGLTPLLEKRGFEVLPVARVSGVAPGDVTPANIYSYNVMASIDESQRSPERFAKVTLTDFLLDLEKQGQTFIYMGQDEGEQELEQAHDGDQQYLPVEIPRRALIIDQFEEMFTTHAGARTQESRAEFVAQINQAMVDDPYLCVLLSMRADFVHQLLRYVRLLPDELRTRYYMSRLTTEAALRAVKEPAEQMKGGFAKGVAEELVDRLARERSQESDGSDEQWASGDTVEPVQLQVVCYQLWQSLGPTEKTNITRDDLMHVARKMQIEEKHTADPLAAFVDSALGSFYEFALAHVLQETDTDVKEVSLRDWFSRKLITDAGTRGFLPRGTNSTAGVPEPVVAALESWHLVRSDTRAGGRWVELVHDSFIDPVRKANRKWTKRRSTPWVAAAYDWEDRDKPARLLLSDDLLADALKEAGELQKQPRTVRNFLRESLDAEKKAKDHRSKIQLISALAIATIGAIVGITFLVIAFFLGLQMLEANQNSYSLHAIRLREGLENHLQNDNIDGALLLALAAYERDQLSDKAEYHCFRNLPECLNNLIARDQGHERELASNEIDDNSLIKAEDVLLHALDAKSARSEIRGPFRIEGNAPSDMEDVISEIQLFPGTAGMVVAAAPGKRWAWDPTSDDVDIRPTKLDRRLLAASANGQWRAEIGGEKGLTFSLQPFSVQSPVDIEMGQHEILDAAFSEDNSALMVALCKVASDAGGNERSAGQKENYLSVDRSVEGHTENETEWYLDGEMGDLVQISMESVDEGFDSFLDLYDAEGNDLKPDDSSEGSDALIDVTLTGTGPYRVVPSGFEENDGRYKLTLTSHSSSRSLPSMDCQLQRVALPKQEADGQSTPTAAAPIRAEIVWESSNVLEGGIKDLAFLRDDSLIWVDGAGVVSAMWFYKDESNKWVSWPRILRKIPTEQRTRALLVLPDANRLLTAGCIPDQGQSVCDKNSKGFVQWWTLPEITQLGEPLHLIDTSKERANAPVIALAGLPGDYPAKSEEPLTKAVALDQELRTIVWETSADQWYDQICAVAGRNMSHAEWQTFLKQTREDGEEDHSLVCDSKERGFDYKLDISFAMQALDEAQTCAEVDEALNLAKQAQPENQAPFTTSALTYVSDEYIKHGAQECLDQIPKLIEEDELSSQVTETIRNWHEGSDLHNVIEVEEVYATILTWPDEVEAAFLMQIGKAYEDMCPLGLEDKAVDLESRHCQGRSEFLSQSRDLGQDGEPAVGDSNKMSLWYFTGDVGETVTLDLDVHEENTDLYLELLNADGTPVPTNDGGSQEFNLSHKYTLAKTGEYLIRATSRSGQGGRYEIALNRAKPVNLSYGDELIGSTDTFSTWQFDGQEGEFVTIRMDALSVGLDPLLTLYNIEGNLIAENDGIDESLNSRLDIILPVTDRYLVRATNRNGSGGRYKIALSRAEPVNLSYGDELIGSTDTFSTWQFDGQEGEFVTIRMDALSDGLDPLLTLYNSEGQQIAQNDDFDESLNSRLDIILPATGSYRIEAGAFDGVGDFTLSLNIGEQQMESPPDSMALNIPTSVAWNEGSGLAAGFSDNTVIIWDAESGQLLKVLYGHAGPVLSVAWNGDGSRLASASDDGTVIIWDAESGKQMMVLSSHTGPVLSVAWNDDSSRLASASIDRTIKIWDAESGAELKTLSGHEDWVRSVAWNGNGSRLASASDDGTIRIWDAESGEELTIPTGQSFVLSVAWNGDDNRLASASSDGTVTIWDAASGTMIMTLSEHEDWVGSVAWSGDGSRLASASDDGTVIIWDAASGTMIMTLSGHEDWVGSVTWNGDGNRLASASGDGTIIIWDAETGEVETTLP
jgi:WD40 repeat protein